MDSQIKGTRVCRASGRCSLPGGLPLALWETALASTLPSEPMLSFYILSKICPVGQNWHHVISSCISLTSSEADFMYIHFIGYSYFLFSELPFCVLESLRVLTLVR